MSFAIPHRIRAKRIAKSIRRRLFSFLRAILFRLLKAMDPEIDLQTTYLPYAAANSNAAATSAGPTSGWETEITRPVVINTERALLNHDTADFLLRGIFQEESLFLIAKRHVGPSLVGMTFEEADAALFTFALRLSTQSADASSFELCEKLFAHREMTVRNSCAYLVQGKQNPKAVFWPDPTDARNNRSLYAEVPFGRKIPLIDRTTKIVSAGSCFAVEIAHSLQANGYNYLVKEPNTGAPGTYETLDSSDKPNCSAAWGIIFNTPSFRQLVEKAFGLRRLPKILWTMERSGKRRYLDPFRENLAFDSPEAFEANYAEHIRAAREAFSEAEVLIITLGLNEVWYFKADGSVFSRNPWKMAPSLVCHRVLTVEENVQDLVRMAEVLRTHNPKVNIIVTLSPVPLHATFRGDRMHVVTANTHSKAVLRVAAEEFERRCNNVYYFPSFEVVTVSTEKPWHPDQRHVSREAVAKVMQLFHEMFEKGADSLQAPGSISRAA